MEDATIEVLVQLQDQMSNQLKVISANLDILTKNSDVTTQKVQQGFTGGLQSIVSFGMAVRSLDDIYGQYINTQTRLENAADRVMNAQQRLSNAQENLNKLEKSGTATTEELQKAQDSVEMSTRQLDISTRNLERSKEQAIGSIITMGLNVLQLVIALDTWRKAQEGVNIVTAIGEALTRPAALAVGLAAAAAGVYAINSLMASSATTDFANAQGDLSTQTDNATAQLNDQIKAIEGIYKEQTDQNNIMLPEEKLAKDQIITQEENVRKAKLAILNATGNDNLQALHNKLQSEISTLDYLKGVYQTEYTDKKNTNQEKIDSDKEYAVSSATLISQAHQNYLNIIDNFCRMSVEKYNQVIKAQNQIINFTGNEVIFAGGFASMNLNSFSITNLATIPMSLILHNNVNVDGSTVDRSMVKIYGTKTSY